MSENSKIEWTDHTFNPWWGCAKVSPGCDHCYAERDAGRYSPDRVLWGVHAERRTFGDNHWNNPRKWDRAAAKAGTRARVFCASMADVFDKNAPEGARDRLWALIRETSNLDWLLLTKRIGNVPKMLPADWGDGYSNVWLGISVVNHEEAERDVHKLQEIKAKIRFLSAEPLLAPIYFGSLRGIHWVIVGGESGHKARPMVDSWAIDIRKQCEAAGTAFFFKQGSQANWPSFKDFESFPPSLQLRERPSQSA